MSGGFVLTGGDKLQARLTALGKAPEGMLREVGLRGVAEAKRIVPRRTGNLGRTIRMGTVTNQSVEIRAGGTVEVGYAAAVEYGSRPHAIVPRRARVLAWGGERTLASGLRAGSRPTHFAARVNHPGTKAKPYLFPGLEKALTVIGLGEFVKRWNEAA